MENMYVDFDTTILDFDDNEIDVGVRAEFSADHYGQLEMDEIVIYNHDDYFEIDPETYTKQQFERVVELAYDNFIIENC